VNYTITHTTSYSGSKPVSVCHNQAWQRPRNLPYQTCDAFVLRVSPEPSIQSERIDDFGNHVQYFSFNQGYDTLKVSAESQVTLHSRPRETAESPAWEAIREDVAQDRSEETLDAYLFAFASPRIRTHTEFADYARSSFQPQRDIVSAALELTGRIHQEFEFNKRATTVSTPVEEVFRHRKGVCQDFAHLQIALLRSLRLPARYVSGYVRTIPPPGKPRLAGADVSHAWLSLYCGRELGWIDFDPTNNLIPDTDHITVAWGRDYSDVPPLRGVYIGGGSHTLSVSVDVKPRHATA
jgi:transglutaminase-like putative cysteine protease